MFSCHIARAVSRYSRSPGGFEGLFAVKQALLGQGGAEQRFELVIHEFCVVARREEDFSLVGVEDDPAGVVDDDAVVRLRGEEDVADYGVREQVLRAVYGDEGLLERAPVEERLARDGVPEMVEEAVMHDGPHNVPVPIGEGRAKTPPRGEERYVLPIAGCKVGIELGVRVLEVERPRGFRGRGEDQHARCDRDESDEPAFHVHGPLLGRVPRSDHRRGGKDRVQRGLPGFGGGSTRGRSALSCDIAYSLSPAALRA
jgi:hypothetical protein